MKRLETYKSMVNILTHEPVSEWWKIEHYLIRLMEDGQYKFVAMLTLRIAKLAYAIGVCNQEDYNIGIAQIKLIKKEIQDFTDFLSVN